MKMIGNYGQNSFSTANHSISGQSLGKHNWHRKQTLGKVGLKLVVLSWQTDIMRFLSKQGV